MGRLFVLPGRAAETACRWVCDHRAVAAHVAALTHPGLPPAIAADAVQHTWASYSQTLQLVILASGASMWVDRVGCPVHLVAGDHDPVVDHEHLRRVADSHRDIDLCLLPGHHDLPLTHAAVCASMIERCSREARGALR